MNGSDEPRQLAASEQNTAMVNRPVATMPLLAAAAAARMVRDVLARVNGPRGHLGGSRLSPTLLWRQVARRLGVLPVPGRAMTARMRRYPGLVLRRPPAPQVEEEPGEWPIFPYGGYTPPKPTAAPTRQEEEPAYSEQVIPALPLSPEESTSGAGSPTVVPERGEAAEIEMQASGSEAEPPGPPQYIPPRIVRTEYEPGPAIVPPQPLVTQVLVPRLAPATREGPAPTLASRLLTPGLVPTTDLLTRLAHDRAQQEIPAAPRASLPTVPEEVPAEQPVPGVPGLGVPGQAEVGLVVREGAFAPASIERVPGFTSEARSLEMPLLATGQVTAEPARQTGQALPARGPVRTFFSRLFSPLLPTTQPSGEGPPSLGAMEQVASPAPPPAPPPPAQVQRIEGEEAANSAPGRIATTLLPPTEPATEPSLRSSVVPDLQSAGLAGLEPGHEPSEEIAAGPAASVQAAGQPASTRASEQRTSTDVSQPSGLWVALFGRVAAWRQGAAATLPSQTPGVPAQAQPGRLPLLRRGQEREAPPAQGNLQAVPARANEPGRDETPRPPVTASETGWESESVPAVQPSLFEDSPSRVELGTVEQTQLAGDQMLAQGTVRQRVTAQPDGRPVTPPRAGSTGRDGAVYEPPGPAGYAQQASTGLTSEEPLAESWVDPGITGYSREAAPGRNSPEPAAFPILAMLATRRSPLARQLPVSPMVSGLAIAGTSSSLPRHAARPAGAEFSVVPSVPSASSREPTTPVTDAAAGSTPERAASVQRAVPAGASTPAPEVPYLPATLRPVSLARPAAAMSPSLATYFEEQTAAGNEGPMASVTRALDEIYGPRSSTSDMPLAVPYGTSNVTFDLVQPYAGEGQAAAGEGGPPPSSPNLPATIEGWQALVEDYRSTVPTIDRTPGQLPEARVAAPLASSPPQVQRTAARRRAGSDYKPPTSSPQVSESKPGAIFPPAPVPPSRQTRSRFSAIEEITPASEEEEAWAGVISAAAREPAPGQQGSRGILMAAAEVPAPEPGAQANPEQARQQEQMARSAQGGDIDQMAETVYSIIRRKLVIERERTGI